MENYLWIVSVTVYFFALLLISEVLRRYPKVLIGAFGIFPFFGLYIWVPTWGKDWFIYTKIFSVWLASIWKWAIRFTHLGDKTWALFIVQALLMLNCGEASVKDVQSGLYINAAAGFLLLLTTPGPKTISVDKEGKWRDFYYDLPFLWVLGYTIWNFTFVSGSYPHMYRMHIAVLLAAVVPAYFDNKLWNQARGFTLGGHFLFQLFLDNPKGEGFFKTVGMTEKFPKEYYPFFAMLSLAIMVIHVGMVIKTFYEKKQEVS